MRTAGGTILTGVALIALFGASGGVWERVGGLDLHGMFVPRYEHVARTIVGEQRLPLWNPHELCGTPLLGSGQAAALYPPIWILFAALPPRAALQAFYALHLVLLAWGTVWYLQRHGLGPWYGGLASLVTAAGVFHGAGIDHPSFLASVAWLPVILGSGERVVERPTRRGIALLAGATALQWLTGSPDFALDTLVLVALVVVPAAARGAPIAGFTALAAGVALGAALAALQLLPLREAVAESPRAAQEALLGWSRSLFAVRSFADVIRDFVGRQGAAVLFLAWVGVWRRPAATSLAWLAALVWATLALNQPFALLYGLPPYSGVRLPVGWSFLAPCFVGALGAAGAEMLWRGRWYARTAAVALGWMTVLGCAIRIIGAPSGPPYPAPDYALLAARAPILADALAAAAPGTRLVSSFDDAAGSPLRWRLRSANGYEPALPPARLTNVLTPLDVLGTNALLRPGLPGLVAHAELAAALGIGVVVVPRAKAGPLVDAGFHEVAAVPPADVALARAALPRVQVVHRMRVVADAEASRAELLRDPAAVQASVIVEDAAALPQLVMPPPDATEEARVVDELDERVEIAVRTATPGILVVRDTWYPGWQATVDGAPTSILHVDHAFRGVAVEAGVHQVVLRYAPRSVRFGVAISMTAAILTVLLLRG